MPFPLEIRVPDKGDKGKSDINIDKLHKINHRKCVIIVGLVLCHSVKVFLFFLFSFFFFLLMN